MQQDNACEDYVTCLLFTGKVDDAYRCSQVLLSDRIEPVYERVVSISKCLSDVKKYLNGEPDTTDIISQLKGALNVYPEADQLNAVLLTNMYVSKGV